MAEDPAQAAEPTDPAAAAAPIPAADLALIPTELADAGKTGQEIWDEIEAEEKSAAPPETPPSGAEPDPAAGAEDEDDAEEPQQGDRPPAAIGEPPSSEPDRWATAPPELKAEFDALRAEQAKMQQTIRSQAGRESALQKKVNELARQQPTATPATGAPNGAKPPDVFGTEVWKNFENEYPELAAPLKTVVSSLNLKVADQQQVLDAISEDRANAAVDAQIAALEDVHPDWRSQAASPDFGPWLQSQPRHIREAAARNSPAIVDAEEAADVVGRFKASRSAKQIPNPRPNPPNPGNGGERRTAGQEPPNGASPPGTGTSLAARRRRQLESATGTRSTGPGAANGIPEEGDPKVLWNMIDEQEKREAGRA